MLIYRAFILVWFIVEYLNTSNVNVNRHGINMDNIILNYLNTSNVNVNLQDEYNKLN